MRLACQKRPVRVQAAGALLATTALLAPLLASSPAAAASYVPPTVTLGTAVTQSLGSGVTLMHRRVSRYTHVSTCYVLSAPIAGGVSLHVPGLNTSGRWPLLGTANTAGIFAAINGDYFDYATGAPIHPWIQDGAPMMITSDHYGVLGTGTDGTLREADVWLDGNVVSERRTYRLSGINAPRSPSRPTLYTTRWGAVARPFVGSSASEVVLRRNKVVAVHTTITTTAVPLDGAILVGPRAVIGVPRIGSAVYVSAAVRTSAPVAFRSAIGHGQRLFSNGAIANTGTGDSSARPRTAVGFVSATKRLLLIACAGDDSRSGGNNGLGDDELTGFLKQSGLGVTSAVLLDGGGSTTLTARLPGATATTYVVTPAGDAYTRPTADAIGISIP